MLEFLLILISIFLIWKVSSSFDLAANFLTRNMGDGIKGPTVNAIASSLPELTISTLFLFFYKDINGFSAGFATIIGSSAFNIALIPIIAYIFSIKKNISIFKLSDLLSITAPFGIFLGRISNFLNKELIGKPTEFFLSVRYPNEDFFRHISQIYEAVFEGLIPAILLLLFYYKFRVKNGFITSFFLINYGLSRIIIENFRVPDIQVGLKFNLLSQGQLLSIPIVILGFYFLYLCQYKQR